MRIQIRNDEAGQTLVFVGVGFVILLMFVGLAIEVGHVYLERRNMQNSADAGALACAHMICIDRPDEAKSTAETYATTRNVPAAPVSAYASFPDPAIVQVVVTETTPLIFGGLLGGGGTLPVVAVAAAACGGANSPCGLSPIAFNDSQWGQMLAKCPAATPFFVWTGDKKYEDTDPPNTPTTRDIKVGSETYTCPNYQLQQPDCTICNCNTAKGTLISDLGRGWVDFTSADVNLGLFPGSCSQGGCGLAELSCWIRGEAPGQIPHFPICVSGDTGVKWGTKKAIEDRAAAAPPGNLALVPIFDSVDQCTPKNPSGTCHRTFNVTKVGCIKLQDAVSHLDNLTWLATQTPDPAGTPIPADSVCLPTHQSPDCFSFSPSDKEITVSAVCDGCNTACGGVTPGGGGQGEVKAVTLIK